MKVLFLYPNLPLMMVIPTAITSLSAYLKERNVEVDLFDTTFYKIMEESADEMRVKICQNKPFKFSDADVQYKQTDMHEDFINKLDQFKPDVLAISANDFTHVIAETLIKDIHNKYPNIHVIMGGIYPTFFPERAIKNQDVDSICVGEGYESLYELITHLNEHDYISKIPNIWYKLDDILHTNLPRPPIDINILPFDDFDLFEPKRHYRPMFGKMLKILPFWFDIGCPYNCTYCSAPYLKKFYRDAGYRYGRVKSIDRIKEELSYQIEKHKPEFIYFSSETFFARSDKHVKDFAEFYKQFNLPFWCETRVETITDESAKILKYMGCARISIGLESGNEEYRMNRLNKRFTNNQFLEAIAILKRNGIKITINNIIGLPDETRDMIFDTINLNRKITDTTNDVNQVISTYVPTGGTELQEYCIEKKYFDLEKYLNMPYGGFHITTYLDMPQLSPQAVYGLLRTFTMYVRMDNTLWDHIQKAEYDDTIYEQMKDKYWSELN